MEILAIWLGFKIFKQVRIRGPIEFLSAVQASPDLDNLDLAEDSRTKRRSPTELVEQLGNKDNLLKGGSIRIFGDWIGKPHDNYHELESAEFKAQQKRLILNFKEGERLEIHNPKHIFEASKFLKIVQADRIRWTWYYPAKAKIPENQYFIDYQWTDKKISAETNVDGHEPLLQVSLGEPALMIYG